MIKLKNLIKEVTPSVAIWKSLPGTPNRVIEVMHYIAAYLSYNNKKVDEYLSLNRDKNGDWVVENPKNKIQLIYDEKDDQWLKMTTSLKHNELAPMDDMDIVRTVKKWI